MKATTQLTDLSAYKRQARWEAEAHWSQLRRDATFGRLADPDRFGALDRVLQGELRWAAHAGMPKPSRIHLPGTQGPLDAQYFVNYVKQQLVDEYGSSRVFGGGLRVYTTLDLGLQKMARKAIAKSLSNPDGPQAATRTNWCR